MNVLDYTLDKYCDGTCCILDAHCHVKEADGFKTICFGLIPSGYNVDKDYRTEDVEIGLGFHPWSMNIKNLEEELNIFETNCDSVKYIGEIGLDFSNSQISTKEVQLAVFYKICKILSKQKNKVISIHAVNSSKNVIDILNETNADKNNIVIMHWFSGPDDQLKRAINLGYYFSCGPKMLNTNKGRQYIRQIPENKMFIETDLPWDSQSFTSMDHLNLLNDFVMQLREEKSY